MLPSRLGLLLIALASIAWGTTGATMRLLDPLSPLLVGFFRLAFASPFLFGALLATRPRRIRSPGGDVRTFGVGAALAAYQVCYFSAVPRTSVAITALLAICTAPLMVAVLCRFVLGDQLSRITLLALVIGVLGTALIVAGPSAGDLRMTGDFGLGILLALGAAFAYAMVTILSKHLLQEVSPLAVVGLAFPLGAAFLLPFAFLPSPAPRTLFEWGLLLYLGLIPTALAYLLYIFGLRAIPATVASVVTLLEPLVATALGVFAFNERLGRGGIMGALLLLLALFLTTRSIDRARGQQ